MRYLSNLSTLRARTLLSNAVFWSAAFHQFARRYILVDYHFGAIGK